jgi:hypothetical protein
VRWFKGVFKGTVEKMEVYGDDQSTANNAQCKF